jgi:hypothetical protein
MSGVRPLTWPEGTRVGLRGVLERGLELLDLAAATARDRERRRRRRGARSTAPTHTETDIPCVNAAGDV